MKFSYFIIAGINVFLGAIPFFFNRKRIEHIFFFITAVFLGGWVVSLYMVKNSGANIIFWGRSAFLCPLVCSYTILMFCLTYPRKVIHFNFTKTLLLSAVPVFLLIMVPTPLILKGVNPDRTGVYGAFHKLYALNLTLYIGAAILVAYRGKTRYTGVDRLRIKYFFLAISLSSLAIVTNLLLPIINLHKYSVAGPFFLTFFIVFNLYAVLKHRLMDIRLIIRKTFAVIIAISLLMLGYAFLYMVPVSYLSDRFVFLQGLFYGRMFIIWISIYWFIAAIFFKWLIIKIQTTSEVAFLKSKYNYKKDLKIFLEHLALCSDHNDVLQTLKIFFQEELEIADIKIFYLPEVNKGENIKEFLLWNKNVNKDELTGVKFLIKSVIDIKAPAFIKEFDNDVISVMTKNNIDIYFPCLVRDKPKVLVFLGPKLSENAYTLEDFRLIEVIAVQVGLTLERITPFEQVKEEYRKSLEAVEKISKQASYATLTRGIAHEINNPLGMILSGMELVQDNIDDKAAVLEYLDMINKSIYRLSNITRTMLKYGSPVSDREMKFVSINDILTDIVLISNAECRKRKIKIEQEFLDIPAVNGDVDSLNQVLLNIMLNAIQAIEENGLIKLKTGTDIFFDKQGHRKEGVKIEVIDSGKGMSKDQVSKIFDPFFTTKYQNTGLGLSIVMKVVSEHGGVVDVTSIESEGTHFSLFLPLQACEKTGETQ
ncbi:MAG: hypothetical protein GY730_09645 [bacterium]|nr:hypothetical protein [bacterium]